MRGADKEQVLAPEPTKTLLLTIALPDYNVEDADELRAAAAEFFNGDFEQVMSDTMGTLSDTVRLFLMTGSKAGNLLVDCRAVIIGYDIVDRLAIHDEPEDERLTEDLAEWAEQTAREARMTYEGTSE